MKTIRLIIPNSITVMATVVGLSSVRLALNGQFEAAVASIIVAAILDGLDGPVARALHSTSKFGAELDSLSDYVNFGVSPALIAYFWTLHSWGLFGWLISVSFAVTMACRLARFNAGVDFNASSWGKNFFMGIPAPAGACCVVMPMVIGFWLPKWDEYLRTPLVTASFVIFFAFCSVSQVPTFSSKLINRGLFPRTMRQYLLAIGSTVTLIILAVYYFWATITLIWIAYMLSMPFSVHRFMELKKAHEKPKTQ
eukprot:TRINITY_DN4199_c0_g1_i1.p1 TRINITY_DN4199_c0_g1~~TRINITY_DN4199_c0_g1_i1.p1  ORF type:complete len:278 (+),score=23.67 TRINITY_DN4199_c0_g1_i1:76-834(+)